MTSSPSPPTTAAATHNDDELAVHREVVEVVVDVIVPVYNAATTLSTTIASAMHQTYQSVNVHRPYRISIHVCCYNDGSTDDSWSILQTLKRQYDSQINDDNDVANESQIPSQLLIAQPLDGVGRGAGYARNRAVDLGKQHHSYSKYQYSFLCMLDSDDIMHSHRVDAQCQAMLYDSNSNNNNKVVKSTHTNVLWGCTFDRDPPESTWHYTQWANQLSDERLYLERYREVTLLQPTWCMHRSHFERLGGYVEAPPLGTSNTNIVDYKQQLSKDHYVLIHEKMETLHDLRVAEDLRFFHAHLYAGGRLQLLRTPEPLLTYRHRAGQSQSSMTSRKLLLALRVLAFEESVLTRQWQEQQKGRFVIWGAGRDGKDFVKALSCDTVRQRIYCMVDVCETKIQKIKAYVNPQLHVNIPIIHFSYLARDSTIREQLQKEKLHDTVSFGKITKSRPDKADVTPPPPKKHKQGYTLPNHLDLDLLPQLPVVVCVAMYRTQGALERNVESIGRTEGHDLWHFS
jgi:glycosyltransferase involved in cell wall biosynthesis